MRESVKHDMFAQICRIQGGFKTTCEISMTVLREHKESLMAVLEALVHDPLNSWQLVRTDSEGKYCAFQHPFDI